MASIDTTSGLEKDTIEGFIATFSSIKYCVGTSMANFIGSTVSLFETVSERKHKKISEVVMTYTPK